MMKWIVIILAIVGIWWAYNNTEFGTNVNNTTETIKQKSLVETVTKTRESRQNAVDASLNQ